MDKDRWISIGFYTTIVISSIYAWYEINVTIIIMLYVVIFAGKIDITNKN